MYMYVKNFKLNYFSLLCHCGEGPLKWFIPLINIKSIFCSSFLVCFLCVCFFCQLNIFFTLMSLKLHAAIPCFFSRVICGAPWGLFPALESFVEQFWNHLWWGIICSLEFIFKQNGLQQIFFMLDQYFKDLKQVSKFVCPLENMNNSIYQTRSHCKFPWALLEYTINFEWFSVMWGVQCNSSFKLKHYFETPFKKYMYVFFFIDCSF